MTFLDFSEVEEWTAFLVGLFALVPSGFVLALVPWLVSYVIGSAFKWMKGNR